MKHCNSLLLLFFSSLFIMCMLSCESESGSVPSLTEEQHKVCDFLVEVFGTPANDAKLLCPMNKDEYFNKKYDFWENGGALKSHCTEDLIQSISTLQNDAKWNEAFGANQAHNIWAQEYYFDNVFLIIVDGDWYTYFSFDGGCLCSHRIRAHVENNSVIIDGNDFGDIFRPKGSSTMGISTEKKLESVDLFGAWYAESLKDIMAFGITSRCFIIHINDLIEPVVSEYNVWEKVGFFEVRSGKTRFKINNILGNQFQKDGTPFTKILNSPIILIKQ